jgi:CBS domain-containing protein
MKLKEMIAKKPITVEESTPIWQVTREMANSGCGFLPVLRSGRPVGVITGRDIATRTYGRHIESGDAPVAAVMSAPAVTVSEELDIAEALLLMRRQDLHRLIVTDSQGAVASVLSLCDLAGTIPNDSIVENLRRHAERATVRPSDDYVSTIPGLYIG